MSRRSLTRIIPALIVILAVVFLGSCSNSAPTTTQNAPPVSTSTTSQQNPVKPITLIFSEIEPAGSYWNTDIAKPWFAEIEKRTGGRVIIESHWGGEIAGLFDAYDTVVKGTVDIAKILPTMYSDKFPMDEAIIYGPVNMTNHRPTQFWYDLYSGFPEMQKQYADTPLIGLAPMPCVAAVTTKNRAITKMEDAKGLKYPGPGPSAESRLKAAGFVPVSLQPSDSYMALKTGTLDGLVVSLRSVADYGWGDVLTNASMINLNGNPWSYVMNKKTWDNLPADIQKIMADMIPWLIELNDKVQARLNQEERVNLPQKYNMKIIDLSQAELDRWAAVDNPTFDAYTAQITAKGLPGDKLNSEFNRLWKKYSAPEYELK
jgi:TRAP-type transport system periplasmic protein